MDVETGEAVHAFELLEAIEWNFARARDELKKFGPLFLVKGADGAPEPLDLRRRSLEIVVVGVVLPVINIDFGQTGDE